MFLRSCIVLSSLFMSGVSVFAATLLDVDWASFRANDSLSYVEVYTSVQRTFLIREDIGEDSSAADFYVTLAFFEEETPLLADTFQARDIQHVDDQAVSGQFFPHIFRFIMKPGTYQLRVSLFQASPEPRETVVDSIVVPCFDQPQLMLSDIQLGCDIKFEESPSRFVKNGVWVLPNPTRFYGTQLPLFHYYLEVYNLHYDSTAADSYAVTRRVIPTDTDAPARPPVRKVRGTAGNSAVVTDGFPVSTLITGTYYLEITVEDLFTGDIAKSRKKFWIYRPGDFASGRSVWKDSELQQKIMETDADILDIIDPDSALQYMKYLLTTAESRQVKRLTREGKSAFVVTYWKKREVDVPGMTNRYFARVAESNRRYGFLNREGWKTDRGRVFILYGEPDLIERNYANPDQQDHEIWYYDRLEGGVLFVFYDDTGFGDLDLVHSTKRGEIYNPNWLGKDPGSRQSGRGSEYR